MCFEVRIREGLTALLDGSQTLAIGSQNRVMNAQQLDECPGDVLVSQPVEHPAAFRHPVQQSGVAEQTQMARDAWLALTEHLSDLGDGQLALGKNAKQPQSRRLSGSPKRVEKVAVGGGSAFDLLHCGQER